MTHLAYVSVARATLNSTSILKLVIAQLNSAIIQIMPKTAINAPKIVNSALMVSHVIDAHLGAFLAKVGVYLVSYLGAT